MSCCTSAKKKETVVLKVNVQKPKRKVTSKLDLLKNIKVVRKKNE